MYLQITSAYYTNNPNISHEEKEVGLFGEMDKFAKDMVAISKSMSEVCGLFHAAIKLKKEHHFNPGATIFLNFVTKKEYLVLHFLFELIV